MRALRDGGAAAKGTPAEDRRAVRSAGACVLGTPEPRRGRRSEGVALWEGELHEDGRRSGGSERSPESRGQRPGLRVALEQRVGAGDGRQMARLHPVLTWIALAFHLGFPVGQLKKGPPPAVQLQRLCAFLHGFSKLSKYIWLETSNILV
ncbi:uncharacterized protein LOC103795192 isoform X1 [Callithrix jacchus]